MLLRTPLYTLIVSLLWVAISVAPAGAQITLDRFYPPVVGGVGETTVTAEGKFPNWPCQVSCDRGDISVTAAKDSGKLTVTIDQPVPPGVAWIRLHDGKSASSLVPLLIGTSTVTAEQEPNNRLAEATEIELPAIVAGRLHKSGEVDAFRLKVASGETVVASIVGNQILGSPMDAVLQMVDPQGNVLAQSDDVRGLDPQLVYRADEQGELIVRVFAFPQTPNSTIGFSGGSTYLYQLNVTAGAFLDHASPIILADSNDVPEPMGWNLDDDRGLQKLSPTSVSPAVWYLEGALGWHWSPQIDDKAVRVAESEDQSKAVTAESLPVVFAGQISEPRQIDRVRFRVSKGKKYLARSYSKSSGFLLDSVIKVIDVSSGAQITRADDNSRTDFDSRVKFTAKADGEYELQVSDAVDAYSPRHEYAVWIGEDSPRVSLSVAADHFVVPAGGSVEIPVTVSRDGGFDKELTLTATGLPEGVTAETTVSQPKGDSAKSVKLKISATESVSFQGNIQIVANESSKEAEPEAATYFAKYALRDSIELRDIWLTVAAK